MDDRVVLKSLANILGIINDVIPSDKKLTNEEKLELIYTRELILEEKLKAIEKEIGLIDLTEKIPEQKMKKEWRVLYHIREILEK